LTNYTTKADISPQQILLKSALIADSIKSINNNVSNSDDLQEDSKFLLRLYNSIAHDQEISGVEIARSLLQLPAYYTNNKFVHCNLWRLRLHVRSLLNISDTNDLENDRYFLHPRVKTPVNKFDNYKWRGTSLEDYCFLNTPCWLATVLEKMPLLPIVYTIPPIQNMKKISNG
jgi:hypothetical protein